MPARLPLPPGRPLVLTIVLALAAALGYGSSDFAAGLAARGASVIRITILAEAISVLVLLLTVPWVSSQPPSLSTVTWSVVGGLSGVTGAMALYMGFRHAAFSVAATISAVASAGFSVLAGLAFGEHPTALSLAGIVLALPAIVGVSFSSSASPAARPPLTARPRRRAAARHATADPATADDRRRTRPRRRHGRPADAGRRGPPGPRAPGGTVAGVLCGLIAGAGFGVLFIGLNRAGSGTTCGPWSSPSWPPWSRWPGSARCAGTCACRRAGRAGWPRSPG